MADKQNSVGEDGKQHTENSPPASGSTGKTGPGGRTRASAKANMTEGAIGPLLIRLTIPMIFGILSMGLYNIVDTFFVGQLGKDQLAALAFTFPVVLVVQSIALGLGMGTSAVISRALGAHDHDAVGGFLFLVFLIAANPISRIFNDAPEIYTVTARYLRIVSLAYGLQGIYIIVSAGLNVLRQPIKAASLSILQMFFLTIPLGLLGSLLYGTTGVFFGILCSYSITGIVSRWMFLKETERQTGL